MIKKTILLSIILLLIFTVAKTSVFAQNCAIGQIEDGDKPNEARRASIFIGKDCHEALNYFLKSLSLRRETKDTIGEAWDLTQIGDIYFELKEEKKAFEYYNQALPLFRQFKNMSGEWTVLPMLAFISKRQKDYSLALKYSEETVLFFQSIVGISESVAKINASSTLDDIAEIYLQKGDVAKAFEYFDKSLILARKVKSFWKEAKTLTLMGEVYEAKGKKSEAIKSYQDALTLYIEDNRKFPGAFFDGKEIIPQERFIEEMKKLREAIERIQKQLVV